MTNKNTKPDNEELLTQDEFETIVADTFNKLGLIFSSIFRILGKWSASK